MNDVLLHTLLAGIGMALLTGLVGPLVVWRRMAYVGDAMGHSALLGVALGMGAGLAPMPSILLLALVAGLVLSVLGRDNRLPFDALLVMVSTGALAFGLILLNAQPVRGDIMAYLFGDILAVSTQEMQWMFALALLVALWLWRLWKPLLRVLLNEDLARVEGLSVQRVSSALLVMIALTVAVAVQVVGILLVTALLVMPPLTARSFATDPAKMLVGSVLVAIFASVAGIFTAFQYNQPVGPCMVLSALLLFGFSRLIPARLN